MQPTLAELFFVLKIGFNFKTLHILETTPCLKIPAS